MRSMTIRIQIDFSGGISSGQMTLPSNGTSELKAEIILSSNSSVGNVNKPTQAARHRDYQESLPFPKPQTAHRIPISNLIRIVECVTYSPVSPQAQVFRSFTYIW